MPVDDSARGPMVAEDLYAAKHARGNPAIDPGSVEAEPAAAPEQTAPPPPEGVNTVAGTGLPPLSDLGRPSDRDIAVFPDDFEHLWVVPAAVEVHTLDVQPVGGWPAVGDPGAQPTIRQSIWGHSDPGGHRADHVVDSGWVGRRAHVAAASVRGTGHFHYDQPRQDSYSLAVEGPWLIVVVADGVSEGHYSHLAADRATRTTSNALRRHLANPDATSEDIDWTAISQEVRVAVRRFAINVLQPSRDGVRTPDDEIDDRDLARHMATTCEILLVNSEPCDDGSLACWRVVLAGDGSCYLLDPYRGWLGIEFGHDPDAQQIDLSVTPFPVDAGQPRVLRGYVAPGQAVLMCTDGLGDLIGRGARPVGRYLHKQWQQPCRPAVFLDTLSVLNVNGSDDRTAVMVWAVAGEEPK